MKKLLQIFIDESSSTVTKLNKTIDSLKEISQRDSDNEIDIALDEENSKALCYKILEFTHLMKGLTGNLSADCLFQIATQLEVHAKDENLENIFSSQQFFNKAYEELMKTLTDYIKE
ncbi:MAG: hypothetical protein ACPGTQ_12795 [Colwellia sp.]